MTQYAFPGPESRPLLGAERASAACHPIYPPGPVGGVGNRPEIRPAAFPEPDVSWLFMMCRSPRMGVTDKEYEAAAKTIGTDVAAILAVADTETPMGAFDDSGRPVILFERHLFSKLTSGRFDRSNPAVAAHGRGGYKGQKPYDRLEEAFKLAPSAALKSASWGRFQIIGKYHKAAGFDTVQTFVDTLARSEVAHLAAFVNFVLADKRLPKALKNHDWEAFAAAYNGPDYKTNKYDTKVKGHYARHKAKAAAR